VTLLAPERVLANGLAPEAIVGVLSRPPRSGERITPELFARNRVFVDFLHEVIARHAPSQPGFQAEARRLGNGWIYVVDQRTPTSQGPVPPEDIIGAFEVKVGKWCSARATIKPDLRCGPRGSPLAGMRRAKQAHRPCHHGRAQSEEGRPA
jgi:hypothetical protein